MNNKLRPSMQAKLVVKRALSPRRAPFRLRVLLLVTPFFLFSVVSPFTLAAPEQKSEESYICPMDPEISSKTPGRCPKCGMTLRAAAPDAMGKPFAHLDSESEASGDYARLGAIPDAAVLDQDGTRLHFYSDLVQGRTVAINFIFTTCTTICPPLAATFRRVQVELGDRVGRDVRLISISVDPATDVPERLKAFAAKFKAGPGWSFVTGSKSEVDQVLRALGGYVSDRNDHTPMVLIGNDSAARWTRTYGLAPASSIVRIIDEMSRAQRE